MINYLTCLYVMIGHISINLGNISVYQEFSRRGYRVSLPYDDCPWSALASAVCCLSSRGDAVGCPPSVNLFTRFYVIITIIRTIPAGRPFNYRFSVCSFTRGNVMTIVSAGR